jgi:hypothetical protein
MQWQGGLHALLAFVDEAIKIAIQQYEVAPAFQARLMAYQVASVKAGR